MIQSRRSKIVHVVLSICIAVACAGQATDEQLNQLFLQAQSAQQRGDYRNAAELYKKIVDFRPEVGEAWANLGLMHQFSQEYSQADEAFHQALKKNPRLYVPNLFLGLNQLRDRQPRSALSYLKSATRQNPQDIQAVLGLAQAYAGIQDHHNAAKWFDRARYLDPQNADAWYGLGVSYLGVQDAVVNQLVKGNSANVYARVLVADSFVEQGRTNDASKIYAKYQSEQTPPCLGSALGFAYLQQSPDKAKELFRREIENGNACLPAYIGNARLAMMEDKFPSMLQQLDVVAQRDPDFLRANGARLWKTENNEQLNKAVAWLRQVNGDQSTFAQKLADFLESGRFDVQSSTGLSSASPPEKLWKEGRYTSCKQAIQRANGAASMAQKSLLAQCAFYSGDYRVTFETSEVALRAAPGNPGFLYWQAKSAQELAADAFSRMAIVAPDSARVHLLLAELHRAREEFGLAESEYLQVLKLDKTNTAAYVGLADVYFQNSDDEKAFRLVKEALNLEASSPEGNYLLGRILLRRGQYDEAVSPLKLALKGKSPSLPEVHSLLAKCYAERDDYPAALEELKPALSADLMGTYHYQLYQIYRKLGDEKSATGALQKSQQLRREKLEAEQRQKLSDEP
jgi:tetratricopeptide (TPR) repeat protein